MTHSHAGLRALAVAFPKTVRANAYFVERYPELVAEHEQRALARVFNTREPARSEAALMERAMSPHLGDPFRGTKQRRVLTPGQTALSLELEAAQGCLSAACMAPSDVDLAIVTSFLPDQLGVGNAVHLVRELGLEAPAFNLESTCSSALVSLSTACAFVSSGAYRNVLVVVSCTYSRAAAGDTLEWFMGDGAGAFLVSAAAPGEGVIGSKLVHTAKTCDTFYYELGLDPTGSPRIGMNATARTARVLRETASEYLLECCHGALCASKLALGDIDFFVFNTPTAWFRDFCVQTLGIDADKTVDTYPKLANIGPALMPANLHAAASLGKIRRGDRVLVFSIGSSSTAAAAVMKWGEVALGGHAVEFGA